MARKIPIECVGEIMKVVQIELKNACRQVRLNDLLPKAESELELTDYEKEPNEKSGYIRWQTRVHFYSIDCVKAGYKKSWGMWFQTAEVEREIRDSVKHIETMDLYRFINLW